ncbi:hypothetical protein [Actinacidiphila oryziradicis]|uniref:Uncharacterized protein n=1 Tax=Actinacidiphila oryziradicis TaxID=2571141 RepID=A0A4U0RME7_9ACTN|nr:hypothetical protein [Actinacidiphila oryziradicis]TJZ97043.1 hypothetical protein FCI23_50230 [Actinacidiphila oryziradicis]
MAEAEGRRFGPGRAWLAVLALDLAVSAVATYFLLEPDSGVPGESAGPNASLIALPVLLIGSVLGTCCAVGRRANHPQTVRAGIAVAVIRLVLLSLPVAVQLSLERCGC